MEGIKFHCPRCGCAELVSYHDCVFLKQRVSKVVSNGDVGFVELDPQGITIEDYNWETYIPKTEDQPSRTEPEPVHYCCANCDRAVGDFITAEELIQGMEDTGWIFEL
jgi:hypothetical protein